MMPELGTLYIYKPTGEVFRYEGEPGDLFLRDQVRLRGESFNESRDVPSERFRRDYEPLTILDMPVVTDLTMDARCVSLWSAHGGLTLTRIEDW